MILHNQTAAEIVRDVLCLLKTNPDQVAISITKGSGNYFDWCCSSNVKTGWSETARAIDTAAEGKLVERQSLYEAGIEAGRLRSERDNLQKENKRLRGYIGGLLQAADDVISKIDDAADGKINFRRDFADRIRAAVAKTRKSLGGTDPPTPDDLDGFG